MFGEELLTALPSYGGGLRVSGQLHPSYDKPERSEGQREGAEVRGGSNDFLKKPLSWLEVPTSASLVSRLHKVWHGARRGLSGGE